MQRIDVPVLIVGAGPVGLFASVLLSRQGIDNLVVERREGPHRAPQAHVVNPRTLEICRAVELDMDRLKRLATPREDGADVRWMTTLTGEELGRLPYERQGDENLEVTPTPLLNLPQHLFEPVLLERVRDDDGTRVLYRTNWLEFENHDGSIVSRAEDLAGGETLEITSKWLLAADGAGSPVRNQLGIPLDGPDELQTFVMIHFESNFREIVGHRPAILYWTLDPETPGAFVAHDIEGTWVFMHPLAAGDDPREPFDEMRCTQIVRRAIGRDDLDFRIRTISRWTMTAQTAAQYGKDRVFLIGDAAHRFPPSGGMGMNTGIQDAHNLVWKLAAVESGLASESLLQTYETERLPVARMNAEQSLTNAMNMFELLEALGITDDIQESKRRMREALANADGRRTIKEAIERQREHFDMVGLHLGFHYESDAVVPDGSAPPKVTSVVSDYVPNTRPGSRLPHAWVDRAGTRVSTLDLIAQDRFTLVTGPEGLAWAESAEAASQSSLRVLVEGRDFADVGDHWESLRGIGPQGALLVRPDQHVAWRSTGPPAGQAESLSTILGRILGK